MIQEIKMPSAGQTTDEAKIVAINVKIGDTVKRGDVLVEAETDKAVLPVESFAAGEVLESVEDGKRVKDESEPIVCGQKSADKTNAEEGEDYRNSADSRRKLILGKGGNEESDRDEHHSYKQKGDNVSEKDSHLKSCEGEEKEAVKRGEDKSRRKNSVGGEEFADNHRGNSYGGGKEQLLGPGFLLFTEGFHREDRKDNCGEYEHQSEVGGKV